MHHHCPSGLIASLRKHIATSPLKPGRNDPCPCGSGKKYKAYRARDDAAASPMLRILGKDTQSEMHAFTRDAIAKPVPCEWGDTIGIEESTLYSTLKREWLVWRDAEIAAGTRMPDQLRAKLIPRQAQWDQKPQAPLGGRAPAKAVARERTRCEKRRP